MKILLSAYACEPNKGSEQGVGWSWAVELSKYHDVWVVTRDNNEFTISTYLAEHPEYQNLNLHFIYVGLPRCVTFWKKGNRGIRLYNLLWQRKAVKVAKRYHLKIRFDLVQHVTFVSYTQVTYMYKLGIPLIWGPVSGAENIPKGIKINMTRRELAKEQIRCISQKLCLYLPSIQATMKYAKYILVATKETKDKIPIKYQQKTIIMPAIGLETIPSIQYQIRNNDKIRIIMAGRLIYWKAFDIGIKAFLRIANKYPNTELHILGEGNRKEALEKIAGDKLGNQVFFENRVKHDNIYRFYSGFDIFLNTTLRDSGCMTMMEAMSVGVPCIAIASGGPAVLLEDNDLNSIKPISYDNCIEAIADKLEQLISEPELRKRISEKQRNRIIKKFLMKTKITDLEKILSNI